METTYNEKHINDSNYLLISSREKGVTIEVNVRAEKIKAINKRINKHGK